MNTTHKRRVVVVGAGVGALALAGLGAWIVPALGQPRGHDAVMNKREVPVFAGFPAPQAATPATPARNCLLAGASSAAPLARGPASGGAVALAPGETSAAVADADNDAVVLVGLDAQAARVERRIATGRGPSQVVFANDGRVVVAERLAGSVAVFDPRDGRLLCRARVADDPVGLALSPDEGTVYVASGLAHTLTALDAATFEPRFAVSVPREPRGVAVAPDGARVYLAHVAGAPLSAVDVPRAGGEARAVALPAPPIATEFNVGTSFVAQVWRPAPPVNPVPSQAFGVAIDPAQGLAVVPFMLNRTGREVPREERVERYGAGSVNNAGGELEKVSFAVGTFDLRTGQWRGVAVPPVQSARTAGAGARVRIPAALALRPIDRALLVASLGTGQLATVSAGDAAGVAGTGGAGRGRRGPVPRFAGTFADSTTALPSSGAAPGASIEPTLAAPSGVAATASGTVLVYSQFEHALEVRTAAGTRARVETGREALPPDLALGRRLFYTAGDARISSGGLSCAGCHPEGRDDGLTWFLSHGPRQTPTLIGRLAPPFNWTGTHRTMEGNVAQTVERLGGTGLSVAEVDALSAFVLRGLAEPERGPVPASPLAARGRELFAGAAQCATCHDATRNFTDGQAHELGGLGPDEDVRLFDTPSLRHVGATAPYFHDGRYLTLRDVLTDPTHRMGQVAQLAPGDVDALLAYMQTL